MPKWLLFSSVLLALAALGIHYLLSYPPPPVDPEWQVAPAQQIADDALTVRFSGTSTLLFDDGTTRWMVDGWFSRPGLEKFLAGEIEPDMAAIDFGLASNAVTELAAVIPVHSHYDHAMDAPEVAKRTGAVVIGSEATANIARGWGLPETQIRVVADREQVQLGEFTITFLESKHFQFPDPETVETMLTQSEIPEPLVPPASLYDYKLGKAYILQVTHPKGDFVIVGSAGYVPGLLDGLQTDVLFLGVGGLGSQTASYRESYWQETVEALAPERIVLIHWDSLTGPLDGPLTGEVRIGDFMASGADDTLAFLREKAATDPDRPLQTYPRFEPVALFP